MKRSMVWAGLAACALALWGLAGVWNALAGPPTKNDPGPAANPTSPQTDPRWLEKLDKEDRQPLEAIIGFAPPAIPPEVKWIGAEPASWDNLSGRVVVIQSWTTFTPAGRKLPARVKGALKDVKPEDVQVLALHTPEGADKAEEYLAKKPAETPVLLDAKGEFCDWLGVYKAPVNIVIDRSGRIRYAGLNNNGLEQAVKLLAAEPFDASAKPRQLPKPDEAEEGEAAAANAAFPPVTGSVSHARDIRGQKAPNFYVDEWITRKPDAGGKVVVIDFWATWCPPCRAAIPHMNALQDKFGSDVVCVGISDEKSDKFEEGLRKYKLKEDSFRYSLALDSKSTMAKPIQIRGIPHAIVMSSDWVVRWQGMPGSLTEKTLEQVINADKAMQAAGGGSSGGKTTATREKWVK